MLFEAISIEMNREREHERREHEERMKRIEEQHNEEERQRKILQEQIEAERQHVLSTKSAFIAAMNAVIDGRHCCLSYLFIHFTSSFMFVFSGELSALLLVAETYSDQDINVVINEETLGSPLTRAANKGKINYTEK